MRGGQETKDTAGGRGWNGESDINLRAKTKWSCAVKLLDSCRTSFPLWLAVWRLTAGLSNRPPPNSPCSHHPFPLILNHRLPTSSSSTATALRDNIVTFITVIGNIKVSKVKSIAQHANDQKQHTRGRQVQSQPKQEHNSHSLITWHSEKFLNCFEMMAKYMNDLMSKYLLSRNVSRKKKHTKPRSSDSHQNMTVIPPTETRPWWGQSSLNWFLSGIQMVVFRSKLN